MTRFDFWHRWLLAVSVLNILIGLLVALAHDSFFFAFYTAAIAETFFHGALPAEAAHLQAFLFGIIGGTIAGYFLLQTLIVWIPFYGREPWAWHAVFWALLLWFVVDSSLSAYHGAMFNVWMINIWPLLLIGVPLVMTYRDFSRRGAEQPAR